MIALQKLQIIDFQILFLMYAECLNYQRMRSHELVDNRYLFVVVNKGRLYDKSILPMHFDAEMCLVNNP